jgi:hypothetical protein
LQGANFAVIEQSPAFTFVLLRGFFPLCEGLWRARYRNFARVEAQARA